MASVIKRIKDDYKQRRARNEADIQKKLSDPNYYDPYSLDPRIVKKSGKMFKEGLQAIPKGIKARAQTRKNIKSMANTDAMAELKRTKKLDPYERSSNDAFNRAGKAYKTTKKNLEKQIPKKYR